MKIIWTFTLLMIPDVVSSISVTGYSGGGVIITCRYYEGYTVNAKFSLSDDTSAAVFTVIIRDLSEQDSDIYYCGTDIYAKKDSYTEVNLNIITDEKIKTVAGYSGGNIIINCKHMTLEENPLIDICVVSSISVTGYSGGGVVITCRYDRKYTDNAKFSLYDDTSAAVFTVTIRNLSEHDSGTYQCGVDKSLSIDFYTEVNLNVLTGSSLIIPLVLVLLALIITGLLLLFLFKKHQSQGAGSSSQAGAGNHNLVSHTGCNYENIEDTQKQLPTNPSDSSNTVYATAQLPTNPSDSPDCVYSMVHEATGDSQILISSADDLNYTVVNFQKKADCPDSVSLRNNQDYSEYTAVNHHTA
ncbi:polymeric immunoglobulin receptor-like protein [Labeo rohita]|nr:polymeric immunoglobulin receptor-like protein [Labeo rohita]